MVHCDFSNLMNDTICYAIDVCKIFKKELCLFSPIVSKKPDAKLLVQRKLAEQIRALKLLHPNLTLSSLTLKGKLEDNIARIAEGFDGIMFVCSNENLKEKTKSLQRSRIPFLFVGKYVEDEHSFKQVLLPLDYRKVMKFGSLWGTYFGRFNQSEIEVLLAKETNEENKKKLNINAKSIANLLSKFSIVVKFTDAKKSSFALSSEALQYAQKNKHNLLIAPASQKVTLIDLLIGLPETKLIKQAEGLPVLCINPSRDMLILCD